MATLTPARGFTLVAVSVALAGWAGAAAAQTILDHFESYAARVTQGTAPFVSQSVNLVDRFGSRTMLVRKPTNLANPADVANQEPAAPSDDEHLVGYQLKKPAGAPRFAKVLDQQVSNAPFGTLFVDVVKPVRLLEPSS